MTNKEKELVKMLCDLIRTDADLKYSIHLYDLRGENTPADIVEDVIRRRGAVAGLLRQLGINDRSNEKAWDEFFASLISSRVVLPEYRPPTPLDDAVYDKLLAYGPYTGAKA